MKSRNGWLRNNKRAPKDEIAMPRVPDFYSVKETSKPPANRVYHNNSVCGRGRDILQSERKLGAHGYRICDHCKRLNQQGR